ncbi:hypothetical protein ACGRT8_02245 [Candidatus Phytoplasma australasiaticum]
MLTPLDVIKGLINLKSYFTWVMMAITVWSGFYFWKKKFSSPSTPPSNIDAKLTSLGEMFAKTSEGSFSEPLAVFDKKSLYKHNL